MFGMHMCHGLFPAAFEKSEWDLFLRRSVAAGPGKAVPPTWLDPDRDGAHPMMPKAPPLRRWGCPRIQIL